MLVDRNQAERARRERIAQHFGHLEARARALADRLAEHQLALRRTAQIGDRHRVAHTLVHRREPGFARAIELDHAQKLLCARRQLLHGMRDQPAPGFLGAREHPVAHFQRRVRPPRLSARLDNADARRRRAIIGLPAIRDRHRLPVLDIEHAQHCHFGHPAHSVKCAAVAVDQTFLGHVLEQGLERDLLGALEAKPARNVLLARWLLARSDEIEHLLARGEPVGAVRGLLAECHGRSVAAGGHDSKLRAWPGPPAHRPRRARPRPPGFPPRRRSPR